MKRISASGIVRGTLVSGHFFARHWLSLSVVLIMVLFYITNRYSCQDSMGRIKTLTTRVQVIETESMRERGAYMSRIRESAMSRRLDSLGIPLAVQPTPPYILHTPKPGHGN